MIWQFGTLTPLGQLSGEKIVPQYCSFHARRSNEQWFRPYSLHERYCQMPVFGGRMQRFLQFRLGCHGLPIAAGRFAGAAQVHRAHRVCLSCSSGVVGDEKHLVFYCSFAVSVCRPVHGQH